jgi:hypothetical protein
MSTPNNAEIRAWARQHGHQVSDRGRIPAAVQAAYDAAHPAPSDFVALAAPPPAGAETSAVWTPAWSPPQPPPRRRRGLIIGLAVGIPLALILVVGLVSLLVQETITDRHLSVAPVAAGKPRLAGGDFDTARQTVRDALAKDHVDHPIVEFYGKPTQPSYFIVGGDVGWLSSPSQELDSLIEGLSDGLNDSATGMQIGSAERFPAGPLGGVLRCGRLVGNGLRVTYCGFSDRHVVAAIVDFDADEPVEAAAHARQLRDDLEK